MQSTSKNDLVKTHVANNPHPMCPESGSIGNKKIYKQHVFTSLKERNSRNIWLALEISQRNKDLDFKSTWCFSKMVHCVYLLTNNKLLINYKDTKEK